MMARLKARMSEIDAIKDDILNLFRHEAWSRRDEVTKGVDGLIDQYLASKGRSRGVIGILVAIIGMGKPRMKM